MTKYIVIGGNVVSKSDGDIHYISPTQLIHLYGVDPAECSTYRDWADVSFHQSRGGIIQGLKALEPREDGNYSIN